jgi:agmatine/peptidylarginine deiminase
MAAFGLLALIATAIGSPSFSIHSVSEDISIISGIDVGDRRLRGDWEPPDAVVVVYTETWADSWALMVDELSRSSLVIVMLEDEQDEQTVLWRLSSMNAQQRAAVWYTGHVVDSPWIRDYGPFQLYVGAGHIVWADAPYTDSRPNDDITPTELGWLLGAPIETLTQSIDGGAIASNGTGFCASTVEYFEDAGINILDGDLAIPLLSQLGCEALALLPALVDEPTKHIDTFAQFISEDTIAVARFDDIAAPQDAMRMELAVDSLYQAASDQGIELNVIRIPAPEPRGEEYPSYLNFFRSGEVLLVPSYASVPETLEYSAYEILAAAMPDLQLVPIPADEMIELGGALHCVTLGLDLSDRTMDVEALPMAAFQGQKRRYRG